MVRAPVKPFDSYKWQWAVLTPSESLNEPPIFLGVLRVLDHHNGEPPSSEGVIEDLRRVEEETRRNVSRRINLARTPERNLIRNSGQYWKALGLIGDTRGVINVTPFGRRVARGGVTKEEFAATVIKTLKLPNPRIQQDVPAWQAARLEIKPLELLLEVLAQLSMDLGPEGAFLTEEELVRIVIPLAGDKRPLADHIEAIKDNRRGRLNLANWPDCAPGANDPRMAMEFLLFLAHYQYCVRIRAKAGNPERFQLMQGVEKEVKAFSQLEIQDPTPERVIRTIRKVKPIAVVERRRVLASVLERPFQARFRRDVLEACNGKCIITEVGIPEALEAAHIIPVEHKGSDEVQNGIMLRADLHNLYDFHHVKLTPNGDLQFSEAMEEAVAYRELPRRIRVPEYVDVAALEWRMKYQ